ncbi:MAG: hypothetical protein NW237_02710 [Cyanobacteriota bacterium]|nr:hypothetical protein [Cyanobacteriota bacterium]
METPIQLFYPQPEIPISQEIPGQVRQGVTGSQVKLRNNPDLLAKIHLLIPAVFGSRLLSL